MSSSSPLPHASPKKRPRRQHTDEDRPPLPALVAPPPLDRRTIVQNFRKDIVTRWNNLNGTPPSPDEHQSPELFLNSYCALYLTLREAIMAVDATCRSFAAHHNLTYDPPLVTIHPKFLAEQSPPPAQETAPTPAPTEEPPQPMPPPQTYAAAAAPHIPRHQHQPMPRQHPSTPKAKPAAVKTLNPVRIVVQLKEEPLLPVRALPAPELFRQLKTTCAKVPNGPFPLGTHWNRRNNLIVSFPAGTTRSAIKTLYLNISSFVGTKIKPIIRFDTPWRKVHLAGIRARDNPDLPIASEEELRHTLHLNPLFQTLNITVQPTWLKKPDSITGTHTSAIVAFEDPDGSVERALLRSVIFAFGEPVTMRKWHDRPSAK